MLRFSLATLTALAIAVVGSIAWDAGQHLDDLWRRSGEGAQCARLPGPPPSYTCTVAIEVESPLANRRHRVRSECSALGTHFLQHEPMRTVAQIGQERTSKIMLNGVSVARRKRLKPASVATWRNLPSPAWAPSPKATS